MNENISESNSNLKEINIYPNNLNIIKAEEIEKTNMQKIPKKIKKTNSNQRYRTPISHRYKTQQNLGVNNMVSTSYSNLISDYNPSFRKNGHENNYYHDALYYKNLYIQTKNNLDKEKQKKHDNYRNELSFDYYIKENSMLKEKINSLIFQLDRVINLVEKSQDQNSKNMNIKQGEIKKLNEQIESLRKNNNLIQVKSQEEIESLTNTITKLNSNNQSTQLTIKNYQNKIDHINQMSNNEINILKEQIVSLNKNLTLCINEKNKNEQKNKEIIQELKTKLNDSVNSENKRLINELNQYKNNYNELKMKFSNTELENENLKSMEQSYNKLLAQFNIVQSDNVQNLKKIDVNSKIISDLKIQLNNNLEEINNLNNEKEKLQKEIIIFRKKDKENNDLKEIKNKYESIIKESEIKNMKLKLLEEIKNENKNLKIKLNSMNQELARAAQNKEDINSKYNNAKEANNKFKDIINELNNNINIYKNKYETLLKTQQEENKKKALIDSKYNANKYNDLLDNFTRMKNNYNNLNKDYAKLKNSYNDLQNKNNIYNQEINDLNDEKEKINYNFNLLSEENKKIKNEYNLIKKNESELINLKKVNDKYKNENL